MGDWRAGKMPDVDLRRVTPQRTQNALYGLGAALPSPLGDVAGLAGDAMGYASDPRSLTPRNALWSIAGMVPGIPPRSIKGVWKAFNADESRTTAQDLLKFVRQMDGPPDDLARAANNYEKALQTDMQWAGRWDVLPEEEAFVSAFGLASQGAKKATKAAGPSKFRQIVEADLRRAVERGNTGRAKVLREQLAEMNRLGE